MNAPISDPAQWQGMDASSQPIFDAEARETFAKHYPEGPHSLRHALDTHPLLELDALAQLAENLPASSVEYNRGDLPIGVDGKPESNGLTIGETIRKVAEANSWAVLKNVEQDGAYHALLNDLLGELRGEIEAKTGEMLTPQAFIFISSPNAVTPYHFDPEHNILLQITGSKVMTQYPAGDTRFASDTAHEAYHAGGARELKWDDGFAGQGRECPLGPGDAVYVPVMAPHFVRNGAASSISLSITWRSAWSYDESDARCANVLLRHLGFAPKAPPRWPGQSRAKALGFRAWRRLFGRAGLPSEDHAV